MMMEKLIHNVFAIIFPLLLPQSQHTNINYKCYIQYAYAMGLLGLIQINYKYFNNKNESNKQLIQQSKIMTQGNYKIIYNILNYLLKFLFLYQVGQTFLYFEDYKCSSAFVTGIVIFYLYGVQFRQIIKTTGCYDFIFTIFIAQMLLSLSEEIAYNQFSFKTISLYSPINLLCFVEQLTFHAYVNEVVAKKEVMLVSQQEFISSYKILGKEDSFRLMLLIFIYVWVFLGAVSYQKHSFIPLIPVILLTNKFWVVLKNFSDKHYSQAFQESRKSYLLFTLFYMLIYILELKN